MRHLLVLFCLLLLTGVCASQDSYTAHFQESGNAVLAYCEVSDGLLTEVHMLHEAGCNGYVMGFYDSMMWFHPPNGQACFPDRVTAGQIYRIVVKYMNDHPERTNKSTAALVDEAFEATFPCPAKK